MTFEPHVPEISAVIQLVVAPVFLLTAIGTIIAALNIRLGRSVDRRRELEGMLAHMSEAELPSAREELQTIARRMRDVYFSILFAVISALFVCLLISTAFLGAIVNYIFENELWFDEYVKAYTNAPVIIREEFRDTEDLDGLFSG